MVRPMLLNVRQAINLEHRADAAAADADRVTLRVEDGVLDNLIGIVSVMLQDW